MRESIKEFVKICAETLPITEPIYEFGSLQVPGQEGFADLRPFFKGKRYIGADVRDGPGVDVPIDLHNINLPAESVGTGLALDTLEHVEYPRTAIEQIHKVLRPDGMVIISSVMRFRIHDYPHDYWRYTPEGFKSLLKCFANSFVSYAGKKKFPHTVVGIGFKTDAPEPGKFTSAFEKWQLRWSDHRGRFKKRWPLIESRLCKLFQKNVTG